MKQTDHCLYTIAVRFQTVIELGGKTATGFQVPPNVVAALGPGKRPAVTVTLGGHTYRSTISVYGEEFFIPLSAENRIAAGLKAGDEVEVELELDTAPRIVNVPQDFVSALDASPAANAAFEKLSYSNKRMHVLSIEGAKTELTRQKRIAKAVETLQG